MAMSIQEFYKLSEGEKAAHVINNGRQLTGCQNGSLFAILFSVDDFLVEVSYNREKNQIVDIDVIEDSDVLDQYIDAGLPK